MEDDQRPTLQDEPPAFDVDDRSDALLGTEVDGYLIESELGRGGMGVVYAATHQVIGKRAAIKVLRPSLSKNPGTVERFLQEARSVNRIGHPNIVDIFAFGRLADGRSYLAMDLLEGESLRTRIKRGPLPVREAVHVLDEIASALIAAHAKGFIHRDLKPDNVFLVDHAARIDVKLLDFGLAKLLPSAGPRAYRTATGAQLGTPDYMSPEQLRGSSGVDHRTDIYALGVVGFEMLSAVRPHRFADGTHDLDGRTVGEIVSGIEGVGHELAQLVEAMMAFDADARPSLAAVRAVLERVRPSLAMAAGASPARAVGMQPSPGDGALAVARGIDGMTPSLVGARPVLPTPPTGTPASRETPPQQPAVLPSGSHEQPPALAVVGAPAAADDSPEPDPDRVVTAPRAAPPAPSAAAGLRADSSKGPGATKLGVAPPPRPSRPHPVKADAPASRFWLVLGIVLVVASALALAVVLAT